MSIWERIYAVRNFSTSHTSKRSNELNDRFCGKKLSLTISRWYFLVYEKYTQINNHFLKKKLKLIRTINWELLSFQWTFQYGNSLTRVETMKSLFLLFLDETQSSKLMLNWIMCWSLEICSGTNSRNTILRTFSKIYETLLPLIMQSNIIDDLNCSDSSKSHVLWELNFSIICRFSGTEQFTSFCFDFVMWLSFLQSWNYLLLGWCTKPLTGRN